MILIGFDSGVIAFATLIIWLKVSGDRAEREAEDRRLAAEVQMVEDAWK